MTDGAEGGMVGEREAKRTEEREGESRRERGNESRGKESGREREGEKERGRESGREREGESRRERGEENRKERLRQSWIGKHTICLKSASKQPSASKFVPVVRPSICLSSYLAGHRVTSNLTCLTSGLTSLDIILDITYLLKKDVA